MNSAIREIELTDIGGFRIGNAEWEEAGTGCTVVLAERGARAAVSVRGGAPASRENALLNPLAANDMIHAVLLSGGSAFGLNAASGVMQYLEEKGIGFPTGGGPVPIVCASCLYDLEFAEKGKRPDPALAYEACLHAGNFREGNHGAGTGATVGKILGMEHAMKAGIGCAAFQAGDLQVGALTAVNAAGNIVNPENGAFVAGIHEADGTMIDAEEALCALSAGSLRFHENTTLTVLLTNGKFLKTELAKLADMANDGYARAIRPVHTMVDGDSIYAMTNDTVKADLNIAGVLAAKAVSRAIVSAAEHAETSRGILSCSDFRRHA